MGVKHILGDLIFLVVYLVSFWYGLLTKFVKEDPYLPPLPKLLVNKRKDTEVLDFAQIDNINWQPVDADIIIVGAGLSGIGAAVHFKKHCPQKV